MRLAFLQRGSFYSRGFLLSLWLCSSNVTCKISEAFSFLCAVDHDECDLEIFESGAQRYSAFCLDQLMDDALA